MAACWTQYLIDTFLREGATASTTGDPLFADFSFDHVCDGAVAACRRDTGRLSVVLVTDNEVEERVRLPGVLEGVVWEGLPYEAEIDRDRQRSAVRRAAYDEWLASRSA
jgi:hypothetical protein